MRVVVANTIVACTLMLLREGTTDPLFTQKPEKNKKPVFKTHSLSDLHKLVQFDKFKKGTEKNSYGNGSQVGYDLNQDGSHSNTGGLYADKIKMQLEIEQQICPMYSSCTEVNLCGQRRVTVDNMLFPCQCDYICWVHGDCCLDFYPNCLGVQPFVSLQQLVNATLARLITLENVHSFHEEWRLINAAKCTLRYNSEKQPNSFLVINECSKDSTKKFQEVLQFLNVARESEQDQRNQNGIFEFLIGLSEEEIVKECEESHVTITETDREKALGELDITLLSQIPMIHLSLSGVNFKNLFCGVCNGVHPSLLERWNVSEVSSDSKNCDSFRMNITLLSKGQNLRNDRCRLELVEPEPNKLRTCISNHENKRNDNQNVFKSIHLMVGSKIEGKIQEKTRLPRFSSNIESLLCRRYMFVFQCDYNTHYIKNPHCRARDSGFDTPISVALKEAISKFLLCSEKPLCANAHLSTMYESLLAPLPESAISFRMLFDFQNSYSKSHEKRRILSPSDSCPAGQMYIPFYDRCQPIMCAPGLHLQGQRCIYDDDEKELSNFNVSSANRVPSADARMPFPTGTRHIKLIFLIKHALFKNSFLNATFLNKDSTDEIVLTDKKNSVTDTDTDYGYSSELKAEGEKEQLIDMVSDGSRSWEDLRAPISLDHLTQRWSELQNRKLLSDKAIRADFVQFSDALLEKLVSYDSVHSFDETISVLRTLCVFGGTSNCTRLFHSQSDKSRRTKKFDTGKALGTKKMVRTLISDYDWEKKSQWNQEKLQKPIKGTWNAYESNAPDISDVLDSTDSFDDIDVGNLCVLSSHIGQDSGHACLILSLHLSNTSYFDDIMNLLQKKLTSILKIARTRNILIESIKLTNMADPSKMTIFQSENCDNSKGKNPGTKMASTCNVTSVCENAEDMIVRSAQLDVNSKGNYVAVRDGHKLLLSFLAFSADFSISRNTDIVQLPQVSVSWCIKKPTIPKCMGSASVKFYPHEYIQFADFLILSDSSENLTSFLVLKKNEILNASSLQQLLHTYTRDKRKGKTKIGENGKVVPRVFDKTQYFLSDAEATVCLEVDQNLQIEKLSTWQLIRTPVSTAEYVVTLFSSIISIVSLALVLFVYGSVTELRNLPGKVVMSLSVSLLVAQLLFLLCQYPARISHLFCQIYAAVQHAAWLAASLWLANMAIHLARLLHCKKRLAPGRACSLNFVIMSSISWGIPICVASLCFALDFNGYVFIGYGKAGVCWIGNPFSLLVILIVPQMAILLTTITCCVLVVRTVLKSAAFRQANTRAVASTDRSRTLPTVTDSISNEAISSNFPRRNGFDSVTNVQSTVPSKQSGRRNQALMCIFLSLLMGGSWIFYLVAAALRDNIILWILFTLFSGIQGLYVLLCFVGKRSLLIKAVSRWRYCCNCRTR